MQIYRLYVDVPLLKGTKFNVTQAQAHYLRSVLRLSGGDVCHVFNGEHGLWQAKIAELTKKHVAIEVEILLQTQSKAGLIDVYFAPLKAARLEYTIQKQVEMGARSITPIKTQHTQNLNLNAERLQNYIIEAAEQCGILSLPQLNPIISLQELVAQLPKTTSLIFCDEAAPVQNPLAPLQTIEQHSQIALLIGPEGGFSIQERENLRAHKNIIPIALGPRILRADTALVAAMALLQSVLGDWCTD